jgi:hypothetical protein
MATSFSLMGLNLAGGVGHIAAQPQPHLPRQLPCMALIGHIELEQNEKILNLRRESSYLPSSILPRRKRTIHRPIGGRQIPSLDVHMARNTLGVSGRDMLPTRCTPSGATWVDIAGNCWGKVWESNCTEVDCREHDCD